MISSYLRTARAMLSNKSEASSDTRFEFIWSGQTQLDQSQATIINVSRVETQVCVPNFLSDLVKVCFTMMCITLIDDNL
jgi:hypothetical protein